MSVNKKRAKFIWIFHTFYSLVSRLKSKYADGRKIRISESSTDIQSLVQSLVISV